MHEKIIFRAIKVGLIQGIFIDVAYSKQDLRRRQWSIVMFNGSMVICTSSSRCGFWVLIKGKTLRSPDLPCI